MVSAIPFTRPSLSFMANKFSADEEMRKASTNLVFHWIRFSVGAEWNKIPVTTAQLFTNWELFVVFATHNK